jgi:hypothetical protein
LVVVGRLRVRLFAFIVVPFNVVVARRTYAHCRLHR